MLKKLLTVSILFLLLSSPVVFADVVRETSEANYIVESDWWVMDKVKENSQHFHEYLDKDIDTVIPDTDTVSEYRKYKVNIYARAPYILGITNNIYLGGGLSKDVYYTSANEGWEFEGGLTYTKTLWSISKWRR